MPLSSVNVDIELTNRCNADCYFCPRDQTPHQGLMSEATFDRALERVVQYRDLARERADSDVTVSLCGLGEPLLNKLAPAAVRKVREADLFCAMASNASLLDTTRAEALLDAGLQRIDINVGERDEGYDDIYKLPWEKTRDNILRFHELSDGRCEVRIILVDHRRDPEHLADVRRFWEGHGITSFHRFDIMNRGGALFVEHMDFETMPELARARELIDERGGNLLCMAPFVFLFIGYDGQYYLCCSDWKKETPLGSVFDRSFVDVMAPKLEHLASREPVCRSCNWDPANRLADHIKHVQGPNGPAAAARLADNIQAETTSAVELAELLQPGVVQASFIDRRSRRGPSIPVRAL